jgi:hypothetical protein
LYFRYTIVENVADSSIFSTGEWGESNIEALREVYPNVSLGCFIKKPVSIEYLVKRLSTELD